MERSSPVQLLASFRRQRQRQQRRHLSWQRGEGLSLSLLDLSAASALQQWLKGLKA
ncbi:MAG: hypothetical protein NTY67_01925 [Cyanobacteria bacterium]|nr:hypothetical protein [Cyanobacteriota bacterium]